jgi:hypothetical protein
MEIKIKEVAIELGKSPKEIIDACKDLGIKNVKAATSSVTPQDAMKIAEYINNPKPQKEIKVKKTQTKTKEVKEEQKETKKARSIRKGIKIVRKAKPAQTTSSKTEKTSVTPVKEKKRK